MLSTMMSRCICCGMAGLGQVGGRWLGGELKCQSGCRVILGDHDEVFAVIGDGLAQQFRIEPTERSRIWTIEDEVVNSPEHAPMISLVTECRQVFSHQRR